MMTHVQNKHNVETLSVQDDLLQKLLVDLQQNQSISANSILQSALNMLMLAERKIHLEQQPLDKANGFYQRQLGTGVGALTLQVPRDRDGDFRPQALPQPHYRDLSQRQELLRTLLTQDYSPNQIQGVFEQLGMHYQPQETEQLKQEFSALFQQWRQRQLNSDWIGIFVDAYHADCQIDGKVRKACVFVVIGIDFNCNKDLLGLYVYKGSETKGFWLETFNQLIERGLKKPLFVVSDDFAGLRDAVATLFPQALHQLCFIHMQRNVIKHMSKKDAAEFNAALTQLRLHSNQQSIEPAFLQICEQKQKKYPSFIAYLTQNFKHYFAANYLPIEARKFFYTTNSVESFNSIIEKIRHQKGEFFQSESVWLLSIFLRYRKLREKRWTLPIAQLKAHAYELRQLFAQIYGVTPKTDDTLLLSDTR